MIPLKLKIKNFLSYGSEYQDVDFEPYNLICLSGKNGHGKSGLLDAMTWAVWGQARKVAGNAKPDQGLLRLGQRNMAVIFDFLFNGCKYRVKREFTFAYGKPYSLLEFGLLDQESDKFAPLTDKTIRKTQEKIESLIGLDYDTFINSAFLRQGSSNEFSKKSPKDRKEILGNILGLSQYESLRKVAMEEGRKIVTEKEGILKLQEHIQEELNESGRLKEELALVEKELKDCLASEANQKEQLAKLEKKITKLKAAEQKRDWLKLQKEKLGKDYAQQFEQLQMQRQEWKLQHKKYILGAQEGAELERDRLAKLLKELAEKRQQNEILKAQQVKLEKDKQSVEAELRLAWQKELNQKRLDFQKLNTESLGLKSSCKELSNASVVQSKELMELEEEIKKLEKSFADVKVEDLKKLDLWFDKAKGYYHSWVSQGNQMQAEIKSLSTKSTTLSTDNPSCPLCEQILTSSRKKFLKGKFDKQSKFNMHRFGRISKLLAKLKPQLIDEHKRLELMRKQAEDNRLTESKLNDKRKICLKLSIACKETEKKLQELAKQQQETAKLFKEKETQLTEWEKGAEAYIAKDKNLSAIAAQLTQVEKDLAKLAYSEQLHKDAESKYNILLESKSSGDISSVKDFKNRLADQLFAQMQTLRHAKKEQHSLEKELAGFVKLAEEQQGLAKETEQLEKSAQELAKQKDAVVKKDTELKTKLAKLKELAKKQEDLVKKVKHLDDSIDEYKIINTALGKDGIQALLIEESIPEIEQEANELLARLTNNQSQVFIESLRDLKKGGTKETLDIKISDSAGVRAYEMFSGGEAFRIDFALRIAISKLLARRSGTALQTLIIDEGFGSQDEEGLSQIMEAIYRIQDDFVKVIVVSHLPMLKDQFPVHFMVDKGPAGSKIQVVQQG